MKTAAKAALAFAIMLFAWRMQAGTGSPAATIRSVKVLGAGNTLEIEVVASKPIEPSAQTITGPDRLVLDFPNAVPDGKLHNVDVNRGQLKQVRIGRFSDAPPVTRVVLDLKSAQPYQLFPSGKTLIVKLAAAPDNQSPPAASATVSAPAPAPVAPPKKVEVSFAHGKLRIWADKATLAEVMAAVRRSTGAEMTMPPGAGQEPIVANLGPAPAREVLAALLNGSRFNFVMVGANNDPAQLRGIYLTAREGGGGNNGVSYPATVMGQPQPGPDQAMAAPQPEPPQEPPPMNPEPDMAPNPPPDQPEPAPPQ